MAEDEIRGNSVYQTEEPLPSPSPSPVEKPVAPLEKKPGLLAKYASPDFFFQFPHGQNFPTNWIIGSVA
jgi:hypothetical protein